MKTWSEISARLGRNDLPYTLAMSVLVEHMLKQEDEIAKGLRDAWTSAEWPEKNLEPAIWEMLFEKVGFLEDDQRTDPETITIPRVLYRGAIPSRMRGMSWTGDRAKAEWFAHRFDGMGPDQGQVYQISILPEFVLAHFPGRGEDEWVVAVAELDEEEFVVSGA